jgi:hypothetical protein
MSSSLSKFANRQVHRGQRLHWGRADEDGLPYRGASPPSYTQDEAAERFRKIGDPFAETFDLSKAEDKRAYLDVMDGIINLWFRCIFVDRWQTPENIHGYVRIEWAEYVMEDGSPAPYMNPAMMEAAHAQFG